MNETKKRFILRDRAVQDALRVYLDTLPAEPVMQVVVEPYKKNRSLAQNNLLWMWLALIVNYLRDEHGLKTNSEDLKDHFQREYLGFREYPSLNKKRDITGRAYRVIGTSELNTAQFTEFLKHIDVYAGSELGLKLPHPADIFYEAMGRAA